MSAEDQAAMNHRIAGEQFDALFRMIRETVRAEMRAEFEGREVAKVAKRTEAARQMQDLARTQGGAVTSAQAAAILNSVHAMPGVVDARSAAQRSRDYDAPEAIDGVPV